MRLSVRGKLLAGFAVVLVLSVVGAVLSMGNVATLSRLTVSMYSNNFVTMSRLDEARIAAIRHANLTNQVVEAPDQTSRDQLLTRRREAEGAFVAAFEAIAPTLTDDRSKALIAQIRAAGEAYKAASDEQIAAAQSADAARQLELARTSRQRLDEFDELIGQLIAVRNENAANDAERAQLIYQDVSGATVLLLGILVLIGIVIAMWLGRAIGSGMRSAAVAASRIAEGDLTRTLAVSSRDEIGELAMAINEMVRGLNEVATETRQTVHSLAGAASEILAAMMQQSASTSEQAAAVNQTTAIVDEVRASAQQTTQIAQSVAATARHASEVSEEGLRVVENSVSGMQQVRNRVESISDRSSFWQSRPSKLAKSSPRWTILPTSRTCWP